MTTRQISIFIENKSGALLRVLDILKEKQIQLITTTLADTADYGIFRIICDKPDQAWEALRAAGLSASLCEVECYEIDDTPGAAADVIKGLTSKGVNIAYFYSFLLEGKGILVVKTA